MLLSALGLVTTAMFLGASATSHTDFGIRSAPGQPGTGTLTIARTPAAAADASVHLASPLDVPLAARLASKWGRITSIRRTPERNRAVGGAVNSFHLSGRAIDVARRPGVKHAVIDASLRAAGFSLVESLDEGDHSHFAFDVSKRSGRSSASISSSSAASSTKNWGLVLAPSASP
jgi:hypothetical protein